MKRLPPAAYSGDRGMGRRVHPMISYLKLHVYSNEQKMRSYQVSDQHDSDTKKEWSLDSVKCVQLMLLRNKKHS